MPKQNDLIAISVSDLHLCDEPPPCRTNEPDWFATQSAYLNFIKKQSADMEVPVLCAGDVFDKWDSSAALINMAIDSMPVMISVPGQHDLPHHNSGDIKKSAYWTLKEAGKLVDIRGRSHKLGQQYIYIHGYGWGHDGRWHRYTIERIDRAKKSIHIALVHAYCWVGTMSYPGASNSSRASAWMKQLSDFDLAIFGDNHKGFTFPVYPDGSNKHNIINNGAFYRRRADEKNYVPCYSLIWADGTCRRCPMPIKKDVFTATDEKISKAVPSPENKSRVESFLRDLEMCRDNMNEILDFDKMLRQWINENPKAKRVIKYLAEALEL